MNANMIVAWTTLPDVDTALSIARRLVEERLAGCAQCDGPIHSVYRWEGVVEEGDEFRLTLKTSPTCWPRLRERLAELHPYSVPQIVAVPAEAAGSYADWLGESTLP
jgi:periplasmic divalent cation tolerance protein